MTDKKENQQQMYECPADSCDYTSESKMSISGHFSSHDDVVKRRTYISELCKLADELDRTPTSNDMNDVGRFSESPYLTHFGSWNSALEAAGINPARRMNVSEGQLLDEIRRLENKFDRTPLAEDMVNHGEFSRKIYIDRFGSWNNSLKKAGFEPNIHRNIPDENLLDHIQQLATDLDRTPSQQDMSKNGKFSYMVYVERFGTWNKALERAGFQPNQHTRVSNEEYFVEDGDHECPWDGCERTFHTRNSLKLHHAQAHGVSISKVEVECDWCGDEKIIKESEAKNKKNHFCDQTCHGKWQSKNRSGENSSNWKGGKVTVKCDWCGKDKNVCQAIAENQDRHFCNHECHGKWRSENRSGRDNPQWKEKVEVECAWCGTAKLVYPSRADNYDHHFCSPTGDSYNSECERKWWSENFSGEGHYNWKGGGVAVDCAYCGNITKKRRDRVKEFDNHFCSGDCHGKWRSENLTGEDNPRWKNKVKIECAWCGDTKVMTPEAADRSENHFCDRDCLGNYYSANRSGEDSPQWNGGKVTVECDWCDEEKSIFPAVAERREHYFCDLSCKADWQSKYRSGEDHPCYAGGYSETYGPNWSDQRNSAIERDNEECTVCGLTRDEHYDLYGSDLEVHHVRPKSTFPFIDGNRKRDWKKVNSLSNLRTCCIECHPKLEKKSKKKYPPDEYPRYTIPSENSVNSCQKEIFDFV